jgi:hypothetical protein
MSRKEDDQDEQDEHELYLHLDAPFHIILFSDLINNDNIDWFSNTFLFVDFNTTRHESPSIHQRPVALKNNKNIRQIAKYKTLSRLKIKVNIIHTCPL